MASNVIKECVVCTEEFDEDEKCPRTLPCSHSLCTSCINQLKVRNDQKCPLCQITFEAPKTKDQWQNVFNMDILGFITSMMSNNPIKQSPRSRKELIEEMKFNSNKMISQNAAAIKDVKDHMENAIKTNDEIIITIKEQRTILQNEIMKRIKELDTQHEAKILYLEQEKERVRQQMKDAEEKENELDEVKQALDAATTLVQIDTAIDNAETSNEDVKNWLQNFKMTESNEQKILKGIQKSVMTKGEGIRSLRKILESDDKKNIARDIQLTDKELEKLILGQLTIRKLKEICSKSGSAYAILDHEGKRRSAQITLIGENLLMHCLTEQQLPDNIYTVDHRDMMKIVDKSSRLLFLDIGTNSKELGRVFVRMNCDSLRAQNFSALCTGETGPSYKYTKFQTVEFNHQKGEAIHCGNYEHLTLPGGRSVVPGVEFEFCESEFYYAGDLYGYLIDSFAGTFGIIIKDTLFFAMPTVFGKVESGLNVILEAIAAYPDIEEVKITDCGIVLSP